MIIQSENFSLKCTGRIKYGVTEDKTSIPKGDLSLALGQILSIQIRDSFLTHRLSSPVILNLDCCWPITPTPVRFVQASGK